MSAAKGGIIVNFLSVGVMQCVTGLQRCLSQQQRQPAAQHPQRKVNVT
jgi:hypothetical protein